MSADHPPVLEHPEQRSDDSVDRGRVRIALWLANDEHAVDQFQSLVVPKHAAIDRALVLRAGPALRPRRRQLHGETVPWAEATVNVRHSIRSCATVASDYRAG